MKRFSGIVGILILGLALVLGTSAYAGGSYTPVQLSIGSTTQVLTIDVADQAALKYVVAGTFLVDFGQLRFARIISGSLGSRVLAWATFEGGQAKFQRTRNNDESEQIMLIFADGQEWPLDMEVMDRDRCIVAMDGNVWFQGDEDRLKYGVAKKAGRWAHQPIVSWEKTSTAGLCNLKLDFGANQVPWGGLLMPGELGSLTYWTESGTFSGSFQMDTAGDVVARLPGLSCEGQQYVGTMTMTSSRWIGEKVINESDFYSLDWELGQGLGLWFEGEVLSVQSD